MKAVTDFDSFKFADLDCSKENINDIRFFADKSISELCSKDNENLLVFPDKIDHYGEEIGNKFICHLSDLSLVTNDIMGFIGYNNTSLTIRSRFAKSSENDNFLQYMLKEVYAINFFNLQHSVSKDNALELFIYLFPYHFKQAMRQGLFKQYETHEYNDAHVRGTIDIHRHLKNNLPFKGSIAYNKREFMYDNDVTQLIRHTIEFIKKQQIGRNLLNDKDIADYVSLIINNTPSYSPDAISSIIHRNRKPVRHPYFTQYRKLQQICLQILQRKGLKYGNGKNKIYGVLFSGSWLWEEYVGKLLDKTFKHYYKHSKFKINLFESPNYQQIIPDYIRWETEKIKAISVADAKYIRLDNGSSSYVEEKATAIYYKTITYMYSLQVKTGLLLYPSSTSIEKKIMKIRNTDSRIIKIPFQIPDRDMTFKEFCHEMKKSEIIFRDMVNNA